MSSKKLLIPAAGFIIAAAFLLTGCDASKQPQNTTGIGEMRDITAVELVKEMKIGWNLGNTLDVCQADRNGDGKLDEHAEEGEERRRRWSGVMEEENECVYICI